MFSKADVICKRVGLFTVEETFTVCPYHRDFLGIHWRPKTSCQYPNHKGTAKPYRSFNSRMCKRMISEFGILVPVGSGKLFLFTMFIFSKILNRSYLNSKMRHSNSKISRKG